VAEPSRSWRAQGLLPRIATIVVGAPLLIAIIVIGGDVLVAVVLLLAAQGAREFGGLAAGAGHPPSPVLIAGALLFPVLARAQRWDAAGAATVAIVIASAVMALSPSRRAGDPIVEAPAQAGEQGVEAVERADRVSQDAAADIVAGGEERDKGVGDWCDLLPHPAPLNLQQPCYGVGGDLHDVGRRLPILVEEKGADRFVHLAEQLAALAGLQHLHVRHQVSGVEWWQLEHRREVALHITGEKPAVGQMDPQRGLVQHGAGRGQVHDHLGQPPGDG